MKKVLFIFFINILFSQEISKDLVEYRIFSNSINFHKSWNIHTLYGPPRWQSFNKISTDVTSRKYIFGLKALLDENSDFYNSFNGHGKLLISENYYGFLSFRLVNNNEMFQDYSGIEREISRLNFKSGETDIAGLGYQNEWLMYQIGRGRESWTANDDIDLLLSNNSFSYDKIDLAFDLNNYRFYYFHGFLENIDNVNRYITGRAVEYTNHENLLFGISEVVIYSGINRPLDIAYLNPVSSHLEIELNDKQNRIGTDSGNAIWQISLDTHFKNFRFSTNFIIDELILDKVQSDNGKDNGLGFGGKVSWLPFKFQNLLFFSSLTRIGTHTYRHEDGYNNFVLRGSPIGYIYGNDSQNFSLGFLYFNQNKYEINFKIGEVLIGESSVIYEPYNPYVDYKKTSFPSGNFSRTRYLNLLILYYFNNYRIIFDGGISFENDQIKRMFRFGINYSFSPSFFKKK